MAMRAIGVLFAWLIVASGTANAQRDRESWLNSAAAEISGHVAFARDRSPAPGIGVRLERIDGTQVDQMTTDRSGKFRFAGLARSSYIVHVQAQGFISFRQQVDVQLGLRAFVEVELQPEEATALEPADVIDARVPVEARSEFERARSALREKNPKKALVHLEKALTLYPTFFEAQLLVGTTHMSQRQWQDAETALARAVEINASSSLALISLGEVSRQQGKHPEAERFLVDGLKLDDRSWQGHFTLGRVYLELGDLAKAGQQIVRTLQLKPDFAEGHLIAGNIFIKAGMKQNGLIEYDEYLRLAPKGEYAAATRELVKRLRASGDQ